MLRYRSAIIAECVGCARGRWPCSTGTTCAISSRVADHGSTLAAGQALRVSQTTVARRIAALEEALGLPLFEKRQAGYALTPAGEELLRRAAAGRSGRDRLRRSRGRRSSRDLSGDGPHHHPGNLRRHLARADAARAARAPSRNHDRARHQPGIPRPRRRRGRHRAAQHRRANSAAGVVGRRLCIDDWTLYCSRDYAARTASRTTARRAQGPRAHRRRRRQSVARIIRPGCATSASRTRWRCTTPRRPACCRRPLGLRDRGAALHRRRRRARPGPLPAAARGAWPGDVAADPRARPPHAARPRW